ncbi:MAG: TonB-dependent receptor plug domain-containing protein, partial [Undibacterium sp.]|nr:TonB-dependent receptor plug domain-containing protein [Opitutaceae bacterium]
MQTRYHSVCSPRAVHAAFAAALLSVCAHLSAQTPPAVVPVNESPKKEEPIVLSPFSVVSDDRGYQAMNTLSGTRLNSKLEDLGASITVVTKQQMLDTAVLDINDVFRYEASTEGTDNFTTFNRNRSGGINDQVASNPQQSNRIRGVSTSGQTAGGANTSFGNFESNNNIPFDLYNVDAIEVSRGPNSNLFGLGAASGTVNVVPNQANPDRQTFGATLRYDDRGGHRESLNLNQPLISGKLALRLAAVNEAKGFTRKPSSEKIKREYVTILARPFKNTMIRAAYERYENDYRRPNAITPRDTTTEWKAAGSPTWDPITQQATLANGTVTGPFAADSINVAIPGVAGPTAQVWQLPLGLIGGYNGFYAHPAVYVENNVVQFFSVQKTYNAVATNLPTSPLANSTPNSTLRFLTSGTNIQRQRDVLGPNGLPLYIVPGTADKSVYDWSSINAIAPNRGEDRANTFSLEMEQIILNTPHHLLAARLGNFNQRFDRKNYGLIDNLEAVIYVDVNAKLLNGAPNPYFKRPYIQSTSPSISVNPQNVVIESADLAYQLTPGNTPRWLSWIGQQRLGAHAEINRKDEWGYSSSARVSDDHEWTNKADRLNVQNIAQRFYLGDNQGQNVDYSPSAIQNINGTYPLTWFNNRTGQWVNEPVTVNELISGGQGARRRTEVRTLNTTLQSFFFDERLVLTAGFRRDRQRARTGASSFTNAATGLADLSNTNIFGPVNNYQPPASGSPLISLGDWVEQSGDTKTYGAVVKTTKWLNFHFNKSDSFAPQIVRQALGLGNVSNPHGYSTEYGFSVSALQGKFNLRLTRFTTKELDSRGSEIGTLGNRYLDMEGRASSPSATIQQPSFRNFATNIARGRFAAAGNPNPSAPELLTAVAKLMAPYGADQAKNEEWLSRLSGRDGNPQTVGTTDVSSKGYEFEATYNATRNWRMKFTGSQTQSQDDKVSREIFNWWQSRIPVWTSLRNDVTPGDGKGNLWWDTIPPGDSRTPQTRYIQDQFGPFWAAA